jgi:predicted DNA-binding transcriptional regulator AlpA
MRAPSSVQPEFLPVRAVAARYGVSTRAIKARVAAGKLPRPVKIGAGLFRYRLADLINYDVKTWGQ